MSVGVKDKHIFAGKPCYTTLLMIQKKKKKYVQLFVKKIDFFVLKFSDEYNPKILYQS